MSVSSWLKKKPKYNFDQFSDAKKGMKKHKKIL